MRTPSIGGRRARRERPTSGLAAALIVAVTASSVCAEEMAFPGEDWEQAAPESQGVDSQKLTEAVTVLEKYAGKDGVRELMIVRNGRVIWLGTDVDKVHNVWSCTKSFTSTTLGLLIDDGKCTLDTRAATLVHELGDQYSGITLRHFATMTSGYQAAGDEGQSSHGQSGTPLVPSPKPLFAPGTRYAYWDSAQNQFAHVLTRIADEPLAELFRRRIADPIGMKPDRWRWGDFGKQGGNVVNGGAGNKSKGISISAREMARFGHLMLNAGRWKDTQVLSQDWVRQATSVQVPASLPLGHPESGINGPGCYGFNWWVNGRNSDGESLWVGAPAGTFAASGFNNNKCIVIPEWDMVIVRLGLDQSDRRIDDDEWGEFLRRVGESLDPPRP
jgi:CubicO group peptidase (beta-lactamase class C family)